MYIYVVWLGFDWVTIVWLVLANSLARGLFHVDVALWVKANLVAIGDDPFI